MRAEAIIYEEKPYQVEDTWSEAYHKTRTRIHNRLLELGQKMKEKGYAVYYPKNQLINFLSIRNEEKQCTVGFKDVPYNWYMTVNIDYTKEKGTSKTVKEMALNDSKNNLFTPEYIEEHMAPLCPELGHPSHYLSIL